MDGVRRIRSKKQRENQYKEGYARSLEGRRGEWDEENNIEYMWEQAIWVMAESAREESGSVKVGGKNPKSVMFAWIGCDWSMCKNSNIWAVLWMKQVHMIQSVVKWWPAGGKLQVLLGPCLC